MTPRRPLLILVPLAAALGLSLVGDAGASPAVPRASAPAAVSITSHPSNPTASTLASFGLATPSGTQTTCSLDGSAYAACAGRAAYSCLSAGTHTFSVRAGWGAAYKVSSFSWTVDTTAPSVPSALAASAQTRQVALTWHAASDPDSAVAYAVYRNGTRIGQTSTPSFLDGGARPGTTYRYAVAAYDPAGNQSATSAAATATTTTSGPLPLGVPGNWSMTFDDEFDATTLDLTKWQPNWLAGDNTAITPPDNSSDLNCTNPAQVSESAGVLHLGAVAQPCRANNNHLFSYAAGLVNTLNSYRFTYGYVEARIYVPATPSGVPANFPAFWANGTGTWPSTGELDVMEVLNSCGPGAGFHFHSTLGAFGGCATLPASTGWHTFGANWQAGVVTFYYDGVQVGQVTRGITGSPMYLVLDNSIDPTYGGPVSVPSDLQVDYVRVWQ